jgi:arylsulfatase A-like enzyme
MNDPVSVSRYFWIMKALLLLLALCLPASAASRPDVLFIAVDDLNHWVGYTNRIKLKPTPNIDRLSEMGMSFSNAHCVAPACNPSRAALMTGMRPSTTACYTNGDFWKGFIPEGRGLSQAFRKAGYVALGSGKIYHSNSFYESEWDEYYKPDPELSKGSRGMQKMEGFLAEVKTKVKDADLNDWHVTDWCIRQIEKKHGPSTASGQAKPLFLAFGLFRPHLPWVVPQKYYDQFPLDEIELPPFREDDLEDIPEAGVKMARPQGDHAAITKSERWKKAIQSYLACCAYTDVNVGRVLDALEKSGRMDNTIIVLWGDDGWHLGEKHHWRKFSLWEEATRAPLIWVAPGVTKPGSICEQPVDFLSIYPTLCELAAVSIPDWVEGPSLKPLLANPKAKWNHAAVTTHGYKNHAVRTADWRYIRYADGSEELYDHRKDPYEWTNLARNPESRDTMDRLANLLPRKAAPKKAAGKRGKKKGKK